MVTLNMVVRVKWWVYPVLAVMPVALIPVSRIVSIDSFVERLMKFISERGVSYHDS